MDKIHYKEDALDKAIDIYGNNQQIIKAVEELAELQKALCKAYFEKGCIHTKSAIIEEIADVLIMIHQMIKIFDIKEGDINEIIREKIDRLERQLRKEEL